MARARNIKPGFYKNEDLAECSVWARFIFPGLWMLADRDGLLEDRPKRIKGELLPYDTVEIEPLLAELHVRKFIVRYRNAQGSFIFIPGFSTHQSPHYSEKPSGIIGPTTPENGGYIEPRSESAPRDHPESSESHTPIKRGSQPPDSLIPDSLIPESLPAASKDRTLLAKPKPAGEANPDPGGKCSQIATECRHAKIEIDSATVEEWAIGATLGQVRKALELARSPGRKPLPESITAAYVAPILREIIAADRKAKRAADARVNATTARVNRQREDAKAAVPMPEKLKPKRPKPEPTASPTRAPARSEPEVAEALSDQATGRPEPEPDDPGRWWEDPESVMARGVELQVTVFDGERFGDYTARVLAAVDSTEIEGLIGMIDDDALRERIRYFAAVGVNTDAARPQAN